MPNIPLPDFPVPAPRGYTWLIQQGLVGFKPFSQLQPWYFMDKESAFCVNERWPIGAAEEKLFTFARRQDNDDLACFELSGGKLGGIAVIHGWTSEGYEIAANYRDFWEWLKSVIDDIAGWASHE